MEIHFFLSQPKRAKSSIIISFTYKGKRFRIPSGESAETAYWNPVKQRAKQTDLYEDWEDLNQRLDDIEIATKAVMKVYISSQIMPSEKEVHLAIKAKIDPPEDDGMNVANYIDKFIASVHRSPNTIKRYVTTRNKIQEYEIEKKTKVQFKDLDMAFYHSFQKWMYKKDYSLNYFGDTIKNLKMFVKAAREEGITKVDLPGKFKIIAEDSDTVYLNTDELKILADLTIDEDLILDAINKKIIDISIVNVKGNMGRMINSLIDCRDRFLIGSYTAMRYSDYVYLQGIKSTDRYISRISTKTKVKTIIPMHPTIQEILIRRNDTLPPVISNQKMNNQLKLLCQLAGLKDKIEVTITQGGKKVRSMVEKWELITTHTARRSGATNMFLMGIGAIDIMSFTGHKTVKSFMKYIKASQQETADRLADHPFFKS